MKNKKWELEPLVEKVCLITTVFYGAIITFIGLLYLIMHLSPNGTLENSTFGGLLFGWLIGMYIVLYCTKLIYIIPVIVAIFLISVAFTELVKRKNPRLFVHPLVLSSIVTSVAGTMVIVYFVENSF